MAASTLQQDVHDAPEPQVTKVRLKRSCIHSAGVAEATVATPQLATLIPSPAVQVCRPRKCNTVQFEIQAGP
jgi:hypothetical protein